MFTPTFRESNVKVRSNKVRERESIWEWIQATEIELCDKVNVRTMLYRYREDSTSI